MRTALVVLLLIPALVCGGQTYTWVDENNVRHWSDTPHEGAEVVELAPADVRPAPPPSSPPRVVPSPAAPAAPQATQCSIASPREDEVLFDVESVTISVRVTPAPEPGATVSATLDGSSLAPTQPGGSNFLASPIYRGTHVAAAAVRDSAGRSLCTAASVTFHVRQHSIATPH